MKCDELETEQWLDYGGEPMPCYPAKDVDEAIAELKSELENACLERDDNQTAIDELVQENKELRDENECLLRIPHTDNSAVIEKLVQENDRLVKCCKEYDSGLRINEQIRATKRALWMARKAHAVAMVAYWDSHYRDNPNAVYRNRTVDWLRNRWLLILDAIIKKEKEYK